MLRIGTCAKGENLISELPVIIQNGFEAIEIYFDQGLRDIDLVDLSVKAKGIAEGRIAFSSIGIYVNPLQNEENRHEIEKCIDCAKLFGADVVSTFAGAIDDVLVFATIDKFRAYQKIWSMVWAALL